MSKVVTVGATALFACILCATPISLRFSPEGNVTLSVDSASAVIGRPLTPMSVAGVNRRHIGARIGATITDTGHTTVRIAMAMERTSRIATTDLAMGHICRGLATDTRTSHGLGMGTGTSRGGRAETAGRSLVRG